LGTLFLFKLQPTLEVLMAPFSFHPSVAALHYDVKLMFPKAHLISIKGIRIK